MRRPYNLFILASFIILMIAFLFWSESVVIDILGFTIFVDGKSTIYFLIFLMMAYWAIYRLSRRHLTSDFLTWTHIIITIGIVGHFLGTGTLYLKSKATNDFEVNLMEQLMINRERTIRVASVTGILFIIGQLTFV